MIFDTPRGYKSIKNRPGNSFQQEPNGKTVIGRLLVSVLEAFGDHVGSQNRSKKGSEN